MGALTLKPGAYEIRPWETFRTTVINYLDGVGTLVFHLRGGRLFRVTQPGWLRDRVRFLYDGIRRQRLIFPTAGSIPVGWAYGVTYLGDLLARGWSTRVDPGATHVWWFLRGCTFFQDGRLSRGVLIWDTNAVGHLYVGAWGLPGTVSAHLSLPTWSTYEEEGILSPPPTGPVGSSSWGVLLGQLWSSQKGALTPSGGWSTALEITPQENQRALFQVSPLQNLLGLEW